MADWTVGGGYEYSDIFLADKDGNPVAHTDVTRIDLDMVDGRVQPYHDLSALQAYILAPVDDNWYVVKKQLAPAFEGLFAGSYGIIQMSADAFLEEYGYTVDKVDGTDRRCLFLFTLKRLVIGQTYSYGYLVNQDGE